MPKAPTKSKVRTKPDGQERVRKSLKQIKNPEWLEPLSATKLNPKRELFCQYYTGDHPLYGNATLSYAAAYGYDLDSLSRDDAEFIEEERDEKGNIVQQRMCIRPSSYERANILCQTNGSRLLRNALVQERIAKLRVEKILTDERVDSQLADWIVDKSEPAASIAAIREFNKLRKRVTDTTKVEVNIEVSEVLRKAREAFQRTHGDGAFA